MRDPKLPILSAASTIGALFAELGLLAAYALMFVLTVLVVSLSAIAYWILAIPRALTRAVTTASPTPQPPASRIWQANPSTSRR